MPSTKKYRRRSQKEKKTRKQFLTRLKKLYPSCKRDAESHNELYKEHKVTYGEMEYEGIQKLYLFISKHFNSQIDCFIDIGSGRGKLCMFMAAQPKIKSVLGIELVTQRHNDAEQLKSELDSEYAGKVELVNTNALEFSFEKYNRNEIMIWMSNLCFDQSTTDSIFRKLQSELPSGTIICCSQATNNSIGTLIHKMPISMSWNKGSNVFIYEL